ARMQSGVANALMNDLANVERIGQNSINMTAREGETPQSSSARSGIELCRQFKADQFCPDFIDVLHLEEQIEYRSNSCSLQLVNDKGAVFPVVANRDPAPHPHPLLLGRGNLVPDPLARDFALELRKRQKNIQSQTSHRCRGV